MPGLVVYLVDEFLTEFSGFLDNKLDIRDHFPCMSKSNACEMNGHIKSEHFKRL